MRTDALHKQRILHELREVGVTSYGLMKSETRQLPAIIGKDEHIHGCVYGQYEGGSAMLVATNRRLIFIDKKLMHVMLEESNFDQIMDIGADWQPMYARVHVNARARRYTLRYVNIKCARVFVKFLENAVLGIDAHLTRHANNPRDTVHISKHFANDEHDFLLSHHSCVLSTHGLDGYPYGAAMFYFIDPSDPETLRLLTKSETTTALNIKNNNRVSLTISDEVSMATMHVFGNAEVEQNVSEGYKVIQRMISDQSLVPGGVLPPIAQIKNGSYVVYKVIVSGSRLVFYKKPA